MAAGAMNPANPTSPWVVWDEEVAGVSSVFVSRLVGGPTGHFVIPNSGKPISSPKVNATRADITFSGNTPYVTWREPVAGATFDRGFVGHFVNPANPTFKLDGSNELTPSTQADVRQPISSSCTANPFNSDGTACQGGAIGTPFFLRTLGTSPRALLANAYQPTTPVTNPASAVTDTGATLNGSTNPVGAAVQVFFQFGKTTAYGSSTPSQTIGVANAVTPFNAAVGGLTPATTYHFRAMVMTDFGTFAGPDRTFTTTT